MDVRDLEFLVALADKGSLSRAADALGLSVSALSHRLHRLEARLKMSLVTRHGELVLTPEARRLVPWAKRALEQIAYLHQAAESSRPSHTVAVARVLVDGAAGLAFRQLISDAKAVAWHIRTGNSREIEDWLERGQVEVGLIRVSLARPSLHYHLLGDDPLWPVVRPDRLPPGTPFVREDLSRFRWIMFALGMGHGKAVQDHLHTLGVALDAQMVVDSLELARHLVLEGTGASILPRSLVEADLASGRLARIQLVDVSWPSRHLALAHRDPLSGEFEGWVGRLGRRL